MFGSVRVRITVVVALVFALTLGIGSYLLLRAVERSLTADVEQNTQALVDEIRGAVGDGGLAPTDLGGEVFEEIPVYVYDTSGELIALDTGLAEDPQGDFVVLGGPGVPALLPDGAVASLGPDPALEDQIDEAFDAYDDCLEENGVVFPDEFDEAGEPVVEDPDAFDWEEFDQQWLEAENVCEGVYPSDEMLFADEVLASQEGFATSNAAFATPSGAVNVVAAGSLTEVEKSIDAITDVLTAAIPVLVLFAAAVAWFTTGRALRPVGAMTDRAREITGSTLHERVPVPEGADEIARLASTMNAMLDRLELSSKRQREFVSDASHELRTPVAAIRTELEVAIAHPEVSDWDDVARNVLAEDERLERLVGDLLTLARLDEQAPLADAGTVDLDEIIHAEAARSRRLPVDVSGVTAGRIEGRADELERAVGHLLDNAVRHADSAVAIRLSSSRGRVRMVVEDDGPGIPAERRLTVFERFGRLEEGRSRDRGGVGLGLAVVKRIVERHGGEVTVDKGYLGGARFVLDFPAAES